MTENELLKKIEELEKRVIVLETQKLVYIPYPVYTINPYPVFPWGDTRITIPIRTTV